MDAFYMDRQKEEQRRDVTIACIAKEFFAKTWQYTVFDTPGYRGFIETWSRVSTTRSLTT